MSHPRTPIGGVIEGFYGRPWSSAQRRELFGLLAEWGLGTYVYGPKDDLRLRAEWRSLYEGAEAAELRGLAGACRDAGIELNYAIAPGLDMRYSDGDDMRALERRLRQLIDLGIHDFTLLFDDIPPVLPERDAHAFGSFAGAQGAVTNDILAFLRSHVPQARLWFCPTEYCDRRSVPNVAESPYLHELGATLHPDIEVFWTGPEIVSETLPIEAIRGVARVLRRKPLIWDNFHANDYDIRRIYLGPYPSHEPELLAEVAGVISNPNCEYEANMVPLMTLGMYLGDPDGYRPATAYPEALRAWLPRFALHGGGTLDLDEVRLLADLHHLPFEPGEQAREILELGRALVAVAAPEDASAALQRLGALSAAVTHLFERLTHLENRELLYTVYGYMWEAQAEVSLLHEYAAWLAAGSPGSFGRPGRIANTYRGGLAADIQQLLPLDAHGRLAPSRTGGTG